MSTANVLNQVRAAALLPPEERDAATAILCESLAELAREVQRLEVELQTVVASGNAGGSLSRTVVDGAVMSEDARYMVMVQDGSTTTAPAIDVSRAEAWKLTRELRAAGRHVYIMRLDTECSSCVVKGDEPLPEE